MPTNYQTTPQKSKEIIVPKISGQQISEIPYAQSVPKASQVLEMPKSIQSVESVTKTVLAQPQAPQRKQTGIVYHRLSQSPINFNESSQIPSQAGAQKQEQVPTQIQDIIGITDQRTAQVQYTKQKQTVAFRMPQRLVSVGVAAPPMMNFPARNKRLEDSILAKWRLKKHPVLTDKQVLKQMFGASKKRKKGRRSLV